MHEIEKRSVHFLWFFPYFLSQTTHQTSVLLALSSQTLKFIESFFFVLFSFTYAYAWFFLVALGGRSAIGEVKLYTWNQ